MGQVELGGLAQRRGLRDGDRLLQVNGRFVDHLDHQRVSPEHPGGGAEGSRLPPILLERSRSAG